MVYKILIRGQRVAAGSPEIAGDIHNYCHSNTLGNHAGAFVGSSDSAHVYTGKNFAVNSADNVQRTSHVLFYASRSSSIYGNSTTVTPLSCKTGWYIKYQ